MLGSEYNWLINLTYNANGAPKISLPNSGLLTLAIAVFCFLSVALNAAPEHAPSPCEIGVSVRSESKAEFFSF